jgi:hypothetical protein
LALVRKYDGRRETSPCLLDQPGLDRLIGRRVNDRTAPGRSVGVLALGDSIVTDSLAQGIPNFPRRIRPRKTRPQNRHALRIARNVTRRCARVVCIESRRSGTISATRRKRKRHGYQFAKLRRVARRIFTDRVRAYR